MQRFLHKVVGHTSKLLGPTLNTEARSIDCLSPHAQAMFNSPNWRVAAAVANFMDLSIVRIARTYSSLKCLTLVDTLRTLNALCQPLPTFVFAARSTDDDTARCQSGSGS